MKGALTVGRFPYIGDVRHRFHGRGGIYKGRWDGSLQTDHYSATVNQLHNRSRTSFRGQRLTGVVAPLLIHTKHIILQCSEDAKIYLCCYRNFTSSASRLKPLQLYAQMIAMSFTRGWDAYISNSGHSSKRSPSRDQEGQFLSQE